MEPSSFVLQSELECGLVLGDGVGRLGALLRSEVNRSVIFPAITGFTQGLNVCNSVGATKRNRNDMIAGQWHHATAA